MVNKVILIGNVGMDPEVRALEGGVKVARIRLATTERIYNRQTQESKDHTEWHTITLWRNLADVADRFVRKGSQIYIEGRLRSREWTDNNGNKRISVEVVADDMKLLGKRPDNAGTPADGTSYGAAPSRGGYSGGSTAGYQGGASQAPQGGYAAPQPSQPATPATSAEDVDDLPF